VQTQTYKTDEVLTAVLLRIQVFWDVMLLLGEYLPRFLRNAIPSSSATNSPSFNHTLLLEMFDPENEGTTIHQNVQNYSPNKTVSHSRGPESSSISTHTYPKI